MQVANSRCKILRLWGESILKLNGNEMEWESCKNYFCINQYRAAELFRHSLEMNHSYSYTYDLNYNYDSFHVHFLLCICLLFRHMDVPSVSISVKSESRRNLFEDDPVHLVRLVSIRRKIFRSRPSTLPQCGFHASCLGFHLNITLVLSMRIFLRPLATGCHLEVGGELPAGFHGWWRQLARPEAAPRISSIHSTGLLRNIGGKVSSLCFRI